MGWVPRRSLFGPDDNSEPIAIDARERGEYSVELLRDDEWTDGGPSSLIDGYDCLEEMRCGEGG